MISDKKKSDKTVYEIPLRRINSNTNPRNPLSDSLQAMGWEVMCGPVEKQVWPKAVSEDAGQRAEYVHLVQEHDPELASLAATILSQGLLEPIEVREGGTGTFTLVFGMRRCLATLYNWCLLGKPKEPTISAFMVKGNAARLLHRAVVENIRRPQSVIEEARSIQTCLNAGEDVSEVARQMGMAESTVKERLKLLELEPREQRALHEGRASVKAMKRKKAEQNGHAPKDAVKIRSRKEIMIAAEEFSSSHTITRFFDWLLCKTEKIG